MTDAQILHTLLAIEKTMDAINRGPGGLGAWTPELQPVKAELLRRIKREEVK